MPAPLTVVIPTLNAADDLPATASALMPGVAAGLIRALVVSDGGSEDGTLALADALGAVVVSGPAGRGGQIRRGVAAADTDWVLILRADTWPAGDWVAALTAHLAKHPDKAGYFHLRFRAEGIAPRLVEGWANLRSRLFKLPYGDQGLVISRHVMAEVGGMPDLPIMEDVALARALRHRLRPLPALALTSAERYQRAGWLRRGSRNLLTLLRYLAGASPKDLARPDHL